MTRLILHFQLADLTRHGGIYIKILRQNNTMYLLNFYPILELYHKTTNVILIKNEIYIKYIFFKLDV